MIMATTVTYNDERTKNKARRKVDKVLKGRVDLMVDTYATKCSPSVDRKGCLIE
jgi:hypothetical protein